MKLTRNNGNIINNRNIGMYRFKVKAYADATLRHRRSIMANTVLVAGAGGFIGGHLVQRLLANGDHVVGADIKPLRQWRQTHAAASNISADLMDSGECMRLTRGVSVIYHLAADVGGIGYITMRDWQCAASAQITQNLLTAAIRSNAARFFFASSACVYPTHLQTAKEGVSLSEEMALPANPEGGYGWAKLYSEQLCSYASHSGLKVRMARLFNVYGPYCDTSGLRAKAPAAICCKFARSRLKDTPTIRIWGNGQQVRSFLYIKDCIDAIQDLVESDYDQPLNIASDEIVSISDLADIVAKIANINPRYQFMPGMPQGVNRRIPSLERIRRELGWSHTTPLHEGLQQTFEWISNNVR